jgi:hypothetical protein
VHKKALEYEKAAVTKSWEIPLTVGSRNDNLNTTQTLEYTKDRYNAEIRNERVSQAMIEAAVAVMAKMAAVTEMVTAVMTMAEKVSADSNDGKGSGRWCIGGDTGS